MSPFWIQLLPLHVNREWSSHAVESDSWESATISKASHLLPATRECHTVSIQKPFPRWTQHPQTSIMRPAPDFQLTLTILLSGSGYLTDLIEPVRLQSTIYAHCQTQHARIESVVSPQLHIFTFSTVGISTEACAAQID